MSKFDMLSGDEDIHIEISGSRGALISILDHEISQGSSSNEVRIDVEGDVYRISDVVHSDYGQGRWVTILWAEPHGGSFCIGNLRDQFEVTTDRLSPVVVITRDEKRGKYGEAAGFRMMGCTINEIVSGHKCLVISAEVKQKFTGIKTFMKQLELRR